MEGVFQRSILGGFSAISFQGNIFGLFTWMVIDRKSSATTLNISKSQVWREDNWIQFPVYKWWRFHGEVGLSAKWFWKKAISIGQEFMHPSLPSTWQFSKLLVNKPCINHLLTYAKLPRKNVHSIREYSSLSKSQVWEDKKSFFWSFNPTNLCATTAAQPKPLISTKPAPRWFDDLHLCDLPHRLWWCLKRLPNPVPPSCQPRSTQWSFFCSQVMDYCCWLGILDSARTMGNGANRQKKKMNLMRYARWRWNRNSIIEWLLLSHAHILGIALSMNDMHEHNSLRSKHVYCILL